VRAHGLAALGGLGLAACALVGLAGLLLAAFPRMDHPWLDGLEALAPPVQLAFLTPGERATHRESREAMERGIAELGRLRAVQQEVQWGTREMPAEQQERLRQFLASRGEIAAGDRMVLRTLRGKARERQRFPLGLPLAAAGAAGAVALLRLRRVDPRRARSARRERPAPAGAGRGAGR
jgi:zinc/manganese transport system permease protein